MIKGLLKDLVKYLPVKVVPAIAGIIVLPVVTRLFPPEDYGNYVLVMATVSILTTIVGWLSMSIVRFHPAYERDGRLPEFYGAVIKWLLISIVALAAISVVILLTARAYVPIQLHHLMLIGILAFVLSAGFVVLQSFLRIRRQVSWYVGFSVWKSIAAPGIGIGLVLILHYGIEGLLWGSILATAVVTPLLWKISLGKTPLKIRRFSTGLTKEMAKYSFPLVVGNLAAWILSLSDRYILEFSRGAGEVGIYSIGYRISESSILLITSLYAFAFNPVAIIIWEKQGRKASQEFLYRGTRYLLLLCIPAVVGISVLGEPVVNVLAAPEYYEGAKVIPLVALGGLFLGLQQRFSAGLSFYKKTHLLMFCIIAAGLLNLGLNFVLIPKYGYIAAAATTLVSYAFLLLLMVPTSRRFFAWKFPFKSSAKAACASAIMGAMVYPVGNSLTASPLVNLIVSIPLGVAVYAVVLFLVGEIQPNEKQAVKQVVARYLPGRLTPRTWK